jgi:hypothetical protein
MNFTPNPKDIYLWPDGYWCYREELYMQPRHNFEYELVRMGSDKWNAVCLESARTDPSNTQPGEPHPVLEQSQRSSI